MPVAFDGLTALEVDNSFLPHWRFELNYKFNEQNGSITIGG
jgi:hypothetical protein